MHWYSILYQEGDKRKEEYGLLTLLLNGSGIFDSEYGVSGINTPDSGSKKSNKRGGETKFKLILFFNRLRKKFEPIH